MQDLSSLLECLRQQRPVEWEQLPAEAYPTDVKAAIVRRGISSWNGDGKKIQSTKEDGAVRKIISTPRTRTAMQMPIASSADTEIIRY